MLKNFKRIVKLPLIFLKRKKKIVEPQREISGEWIFIDKNKQKHQLILTNKFNIVIDNNKLDTKLVESNPNSIIFIDKYGYILRIILHKNRPVSIYDEAENISYNLV